MASLRLWLSLIHILTELHNYICDLKNLEVHTGLHILGEPPLEDGLTEYLWLLTRLDNGAIPSLNQTLAGQYGYDYYYLLENSSLIYEPLNLTFNMLIDKIGSQCREVIRILQDHDFAEEGIAQVLRQPWVQEEMCIRDRACRECKLFGVCGGGCFTRWRGRGGKAAEECAMYRVFSRHV